MNVKTLEKTIFYLILFSLIFVFVFNIATYDPLLGYDAEAHHSYVDYLSMYLPRDFQLPTEDASREFFNPPMGYLFPSFIQVICRNVVDSVDLVQTCRPIYGKISQIFQSILFFASLFIYLKIFKKLTNSKLLNINVLIVIGILTVNYRTFSMIRGEPYIVFFLSCLLYRLLVLFENKFNYKLYDQVIFGLIIGSLALSRQWAILLFPAIFLLLIYIDSNTERLKYLKFITGSFVVGFFTSFWFYLSLFLRYGTFTAFNMEPTTFSFSNQPRSFYFPNISSLEMMFSKPIRPNFFNEVFPILYSDLWGDYWGYFTFTRNALVSGRNQQIIGDYLARINIVSILVTIFFIFVICKSLKYLNIKNGSNLFITYVSLSIFISFVGYLWFLIKYPALDSGDTIKATYMIQAFHLIGVLSILYLEKLKQKNLKRYALILGIFLATFIHNYSAMLNHY